MKKLIRVLFCLTLVLALALPTVTLAMAFQYPVWVNGQRFDDAMLEISCGNGKAVLTPPANAGDPYTVTLTDATLSDEYLDPAGSQSEPLGGAIYADGDLKVVLSGTNSISLASNKSGDGICATGDVTVSGSGTLSVVSASPYYGNGLVSKNGGIKVETTGAIDITTKHYCLYALEGDIVIDGSGDFDMDSNDAVGTRKNVYISRAGDVSITGVYNGIWIPWMYDTSALIISGGDSSSLTVSSTNGNAFYGPSIKLNGSTAPITFTSATTDAIDYSASVGGTNYNQYSIIAGGRHEKTVTYGKVVPYDVWVNGARFTNANAQTGITCGGGRATLTPPDDPTDPYILTLDSAEITKESPVENDYDSGIYSKVDLEIVVKNDSSISITLSQDSYGILCDGDITLSGEGNLTIDEQSWNSAISCRGDFVSEMSGDLSIKSASSGISPSGSASFTGSGDLTIESSNTDVSSLSGDVTFNSSGDITLTSDSTGVQTLNGNIDLGGSGKIQITANSDGPALYVQGGNAIFSGSEEVTLSTKEFAGIWMYSDSYQVLLNGTAPLITITAGTGEKAILTTRNEPVGGTNFAKYAAIEGTPDTEKLVYALAKDITEVEVTGVQTPTADMNCTTDTVEITTDPEDAYVTTGTGAPVITWYDETDGKPVAATDTFTKEHEYSLRVQIQAKPGYVFRADSDKEYTGSATVGGQTAPEAKVADSVLSLTGPALETKVITYGVTVAVNDANMGTASADVTVAEEGDTVTLSAVASDGYFLKEWQSNEVTVDTSVCTFTMPGKSVTVTAMFETVTLSEITVTSDPEKTEYREGETFDPAGLEITAKFNDGTSGPVTDYTIKPDGALALTDTEIEISYTVNGVTKTVKIPVTVTAGTYNIIEGANAKWQKGSGLDLLIVSDAPFAKFVSVKVNDSVLDAANYDASEGSTRIRLHGSYLEGLKEGDYRFEIISTDGSAATMFTILAKAPVNYIVSFNMNGHGAAVAPQTVVEGGKAQKPKVNNEKPWIFGGWYKDAECKIEFNFNDPIMKDTTVYAKWTKDMPGTGDDTDIAALVTMLLLAVGTMMAIVVLPRRKHN